jgi:hypothetical protein
MVIVFFVKIRGFSFIQFQISTAVEDEVSRRDSEQKVLTHASWLQLEEELRDLHELITTFSAMPAVTV